MKSLGWSWSLFRERDNRWWDGRTWRGRRCWFFFALVLCLVVSSIACDVMPRGPANLPTISPSATPTAKPEPTPTPTPPQGEWELLPPGLPTQEAIDDVNAVAQEVGRCPEGYPSRCVIGKGYPSVSREEEHELGDKFTVDVTKGLAKKGWIAGFHTEHPRPDELTMARSMDGPFYSFKPATLGGQVVVAWALMPREGCFGGKDEHGYPPLLGCPGVGGGSFRGLWQPLLVARIEVVR